MVRGTLVQPEKKNYGRLSRRSIDFLQEKRQEEAEILANEIKDGCKSVLENVPSIFIRFFQSVPRKIANMHLFHVKIQQKKSLN